MQTNPPIKGASETSKHNFNILFFESFEFDKTEDIINPINIFINPVNIQFNIPKVIFV